MTQLRHRPVFVDEVMSLLAPRAGGLYVDGTVGDGGHTLLLLSRSAPDGRVIGFDRDAEALARARARLVEEAVVAEDAAGSPTSAPRAMEKGERLALVHRNYAAIAETLAELGLSAGADGILLDLGVSTMQLKAPERGFSFRDDGPIDMRMNRDAADDEPTAMDVLLGLDEEELESVLREYGEERFARRIAQALVRARDAGSLRTTRELADVVYHSTPPKARFGAIHPATRTFQALRIATNRELDHLEATLATLPRALAPGGTAVVLTYHSLEDRLCKRAFRASAKLGEVVDLTKRPLTPSLAEVEANPRARSAKLRAIRRAA